MIHLPASLSSGVTFHEKPTVCLLYTSLEVPPCQDDQGNAVNVFGKPAESHIRLEPDDAVINDGRVNGQGNHFHDESRLGIACAGYGVKQDE